MYRPRTDFTRWMRDQILAALYEHVELNTSELGEAIGHRMLWSRSTGKAWCDACRDYHEFPVQRIVTSIDLQPTMARMLYHDELYRYRSDSAQIWRWMLGPEAPLPTDLSAWEIEL